MAVAQEQDSEVAQPGRFIAITPKQVRCQRSIECNGCDDPIVTAHHHCTICYRGYYDLRLHCVAAGTHCLNDDHWLIKRIVADDGAVVEAVSHMLPPRWIRDNVSTHTPADSTRRGPSISHRLLYVADSRSCSDAFPQVCAFLVKQAGDLLGLCHPMALLLKVFQSLADLDLLRDRIHSIMDVKVADRTKSVDPQSKHLMAAREWVLFQQGKLQRLEARVNGYIFEGNEKPKTGAELMHLLATAKLEEGQFESASSRLRAVGNAPDGVIWTALLKSRKYYTLWPLSSGKSLISMNARSPWHWRTII
ncbi:hypothetical protein DOTSEDRAFT_37736 [Dothistroma septosporum NZE10]|uniref:Uncharacterized protein n=1 Tax=Dothistroma septosporum (strain NZE10 / CBS 128990) TaxID=675120 RepID=N1PF57_DOTSN|nr:hypothetical protein DOTSEDRAFT_37736 [Dothistroma septosporum NZE10]